MFQNNGKRNRFTAGRQLRILTDVLHGDYFFLWLLIQNRRGCSRRRTVKRLSGTLSVTVIVISVDPGVSGESTAISGMVNVSLIRESTVPVHLSVFVKIVGILFPCNHTIPDYFPFVIIIVRSPLFGYQFIAGRLRSSIDDNRKSSQKNQNQEKLKK